MKIELTDEEYTTLLLMLGYATGAAFGKGDREMAYSFVRLANTINKDNPDYRPYEIPPEYSVR